MGTGNYISLYYHLVFSTKERRPSIHPDVEECLYAYIQACTKARPYAVLRLREGTRRLPWIAPLWVGLKTEFEYLTT